MIGVFGAWCSISGYHCRLSASSARRHDLQTYLRLDVVERGRADDREADQEHVRLGVRQWSESVVILLSSGIPQTQADGLTVHHHACRIVVEPVERQ